LQAAGPSCPADHHYVQLNRRNPHYSPSADWVLGTQGPATIIEVPYLHFAQLVAIKIQVRKKNMQQT
jgi:hypothetical protein